MAKTNERLEAIIRVFIAIISGFILSIWFWIIKIFTIVNFIITLVTGDRNKELSRYCEIWTTQAYHYAKYVMFGTNKRPFPFTQLKNPMTKFEK